MSELYDTDELVDQVLDAVWTRAYLKNERARPLDAHALADRAMSDVELEVRELDELELEKRARQARRYLERVGAL